MWLWEYFKKHFKSDIPIKIQQEIIPDTLDLHGMTIEQGYRTAKEFVENTKYKKIKIITGKGKMDEEFIHWFPHHKIINNNGSYWIILE